VYVQRIHKVNLKINIYRIFTEMREEEFATANNNLIVK
jgi:hypothetical protein